MTDEKNLSESSSPGATPSSARATIARRTEAVAFFLRRLPVAIATKLASCFMPWGVPIDSGWYWTDSIGSVLCLRPIISPSSLSALISKQSGRLSRSTAREW